MDGPGGQRPGTGGTSPCQGGARRHARPQGCLSDVPRTGPRREDRRKVLARGADGEETVGGRLEKLRADGWHILHSVPVGNRGSDIDHVLIGPGGIYTLNTKTHPDGKIWVGKTVVKVNGRNQPYLRNSRFEADRAAKLLSAAVRWQVEVTPALVFLTGTFIPQVTIKDKPEGVIILDRLDLPRYFRRRPPRLDPSQVAHVFELARRSSSWC